MDSLERPFLLIGGTTKAATTSLFSYLRSHPSVCASSLKESRFFLDEDYPLSAHHRFRDGLQYFDRLFLPSEEPVSLYVEATPDYLYSPGTPRRVRAALKNVKWVFVLREPRDRFVSWFGFARQCGLIPARTSLQDFIDMQDRSMDAGRSVPQHCRVLAQGRYSGYLERYYEVFDRRDILVLYYEAFTQDPRSSMLRLCGFCGIDASFYDHFEFRRLNPTRPPIFPLANRAYMRISRWMRYQVHDKPRLHSVLRRIRASAAMLWPQRRVGRADMVGLSRESMAFLDEYYCGEAERVARVVGERPTWNG